MFACQVVSPMRVLLRPEPDQYASGGTDTPQTPRGAVGAPPDSALLAALPAGVHRPAELLALLPQGGDRLFDVVGHRFDGVRARERVDGPGQVGLVRDDLLGAQGEPRGLLRRQRD